MYLKGVQTPPIISKYYIISPFIITEVDPNIFKNLKVIKGGANSRHLGAMVMVYIWSVTH